MNRRLPLIAGLLVLAALLVGCTITDSIAALPPAPATPQTPGPVLHVPSPIAKGTATTSAPPTAPADPGTPPPAAPADTGQPQWGEPSKTAGCQVAGALPDSACTPGDIFPQATKSMICTPGYSRSVRNVPAQEKDAVYAEYGIPSHTPGQYEVDHLVSLELGGSNDISNLWPEAAAPAPGFHEKDEVENALHDQVCAGQIDLLTAQRAIATNWLTIYDQIHGRPPSAPPPINPGQPTAPPLGQGGVAPNGRACPPNVPVKGNVRRDGTRIYHLPNDPSYANTQPEQCFASAADAQAAGFRAPR